MAPFDLLSDARRLIGIPSDSGTAAVAKFLTPFVRKLGFHLFCQKPSSPTGLPEFNLIGYTQKKGGNLCPSGLALVTHLDTVPSGDPSLWTETKKDPFRATLKGDKIYGLGSADTKLDFLCKLKAIEAVGLKRLKIPLALVGTFGEERALAGARLFCDSKILSPRFVLVGEPSEMKPVLGHKGILYLKGMFACRGAGPVPSENFLSPSRFQKIVFKGRAAHGAMPHLGKNAIYEAIDWLAKERRKKPNLRLGRINGGTVHNVVPAECEIEVTVGDSPSRQIDFLIRFLLALRESEREISKKRNPRFDPPVTTCNVGVIRTGKDRLEIEFDYRLVSEGDGEWLKKFWKAFGKSVSGAAIEEIRSNPPMNTSPRSEMAGRVKGALEAVGLSADFLYKSGNTEGVLFNQMGGETVVIGPGISTGNIHQPNEFNTLGELRKAVEFYTAFLKAFC